jgi:hypothetical protein
MWRLNMAGMVRKQVYIEPQQEAALKQLARETGGSEAEIIRGAIDRHARAVAFSRRDLAAWKRERAFIADLISSGPVAGGRRWRREELHDR